MVLSKMYGFLFIFLVKTTYFKISWTWITFFVCLVPNKIFKKFRFYKMNGFEENVPVSITFSSEKLLFQNFVELFYRFSSYSVSLVLNYFFLHNLFMDFYNFSEKKPYSLRTTSFFLWKRRMENVNFFGAKLVLK